MGVGGRVQQSLGLGAFGIDGGAVGMKELPDGRRQWDELYEPHEDEDRNKERRDAEMSGPLPEVAILPSREGGPCE